MIEVEVKLRIENLEDIKEKLTARGFRTRKVLTETDIYFDDAACNIRKHGQALRVRKIFDPESGDELSLITFKGAKLDKVSMARQELETTTGSADMAAGILEALGYHPVDPSVIKRRRLMLCGDMCACLDDVKNLGTFLELEIMADDESGRRAGLDRIEEILGLLGYSMKETTRSSYLSQLRGEED